MKKIWSQFDSRNSLLTLYVAFVVILTIPLFVIEAQYPYDRIINGSYVGLILIVGLIIRYRIALLERDKEGGSGESLERFMDEW